MTKKVEEKKEAGIKNQEVEILKSTKNDKPKTTTAKAGKRSEKALKEVEEKQAKEARKSEVTETGTDTAKAKPAHNPPRTKLERSSKKYREVAKLLEEGKQYELSEALALAVKTSATKFDSSVELHINLAIDPRKADQNIRGTVKLPAGTGKTLRVAVFAEDDDAAAAKKAGADVVGADDLLAKLDKEQIDFDTLITTPMMMARLAKYARLLGPKGLMPNPKSGTVTKDVTAAINDAKAGQVEYRTDSTGIIHLGFGKVSFGADKLAQNANVVLSSIKSAKPASVKGTYVKSVYLTTTMGPSIKVLTSSI